MIGDFYPDLLDMEYSDGESEMEEETNEQGGFEESADIANEVQESLPAKMNDEARESIESEDEEISVRAEEEREDSDEEMEAAAVAPSSPTPEDVAYANEAHAKIRAVHEEVEVLKKDISALDEARATLLQRLVVERLLRRSLSSAELSITLAAGVHRNKAGEVVSKLFKAIEKLDAILSFGNSEIASSRKQAIKFVESLLEIADTKLNKAKSLVKFVERIVASPRPASQRRQAPTGKSSPTPSLLPHERFLQRKRASPSQPTSGSPDTKSAELRPVQEPSLEVETSRASPEIARQRVDNYNQRRQHPVPKYEIVNGKRSVDIFLGLPRGFDIERDLSLELKNSNVLQVQGFSEPLEFAIDPKTMDVRNITYKAMPSQGLLMITIPRVEPPRRVMHPAYRSMPQTRRVVDPSAFWW